MIAGIENNQVFLSGASLEGGQLAPLRGAPGYFVLFLGGGKELYEGLRALGPSDSAIQALVGRIEAECLSRGQPNSATVHHPKTTGIALVFDPDQKLGVFVLSEHPSAARIARGGAGAPSGDQQVACGDAFAAVVLGFMAYLGGGGGVSLDDLMKLLDSGSSRKGGARRRPHQFL